MQLTVGKLVLIDEEFFQFFMLYQGGCAFFLTLLIGPPLVSRDMTNNALPLYLSRPFSRAEYVLGKMSVLLILLSIITWIPILLVFLFQSYLEGWGWFTQNLSDGGGDFHRKLDLDCAAGAPFVGDLFVGQVENCRERRVNRSSLHPRGVCRGDQ